jgi:hypothetical protein
VYSWSFFYDRGFWFQPDKHTPSAPSTSPWLLLLDWLPQRLNGFACSIRMLWCSQSCIQVICKGHRHHQTSFPSPTLTSPLQKGIWQPCICLLAKHSWQPVTRLLAKNSWPAGTRLLAENSWPAATHLLAESAW